jgi:fructokinase
VNTRTGRLCIFGEVLFDRFPDGKQVLGGAPFNVAWHLQAFGQAPYFVSRIGADPEGDSVRESMRNWGMDLAGLQTDSTHPTGRVEVSITAGEPSYDIVHPCAYDAIAPPASMPDCRLLYHGSLALRSPISRSALQHLLARHSETVFVDVNLRPPWWHLDDVLAMLDKADWVKLNGDELLKLAAPDGLPEDGAAEFLERHGLEGLVLTHGARGAEVLTASGERCTVTPDATVEVVDTVGAGDAFASVVILGLIQGWPTALMLQRAQAFASRLVGNRGATLHDPALYQPFIDDWRLTV